MYNEEEKPKRPIRWGMIGGGRGSEIGYAHRTSAMRDDIFELVAGAFDINPDACRSFGVALGLDEKRCYSDYKTLINEESKREDGIEALSIAAPNFLHYESTKAALEAGLHVICEKPLSFRSDEAKELVEISRDKNLLLGVSYGYSGFPIVHQAKSMIKRGVLGRIRIVNMQFAHGFHSAPVNSPGASWRINPKTSGPSYVLGDVGIHAFHLGQLLTDLEVNQILCSRQSFIPERAPLEDNANVLIKYKGGAIGNLWASSVNAGSMHQQKVRVIGDKASIEWWDEHPNQLRFEIQGEPVQILERGMPYLDREDFGVNQDRIGGGHAEGFFESWANIYYRYAKGILSIKNNEKPNLWYPNGQEGLYGVRFIEASVNSSNKGEVWVDF